MSPRWGPALRGGRSHAAPGPRVTAPPGPARGPHPSRTRPAPRRPRTGCARLPLPGQQEATPPTQNSFRFTSFWHSRQDGGHHGSQARGAPRQHPRWPRAKERAAEAETERHGARLRRREPKPSLPAPGGPCRQAGPSVHSGPRLAHAQCVQVRQGQQIRLWSRSQDPPPETSWPTGCTGKCAL